jgi:ABC-type multidrug transport system ATPase subunit
MRIILSDAGKRFNREWIFRHVDYQFFSSNAYAITGPNGSGKSTLLQFIAGAIMPSEGKISYSANDGVVVADYYRLLSIAAPYLETIEEMTAVEFLRFHEVFKPLMPDITVAGALERVGLAEARDKQIRYFSSGMKQRIKLAQAFFSDTPVLLLDEPTTNLDAPGITLYHQMIREYTGGRILIISSNDRMEYEFCTHKLEMNLLPH